MKKSIPYTLALLLASSIVTTAEDLLIFDIGSLDADPPGSFAPDFTAPNLTGGDLARTGVTHEEWFDGTEGSAAHPDGLYGAGNWPTTSERDPGSYLEFSVTPDANFSLTVDSLSFTLFTEHVVVTLDNDTEPTTFIGPETWDIAYSFDGFATSTTLDTVSTPAAESVSEDEGRYTQHLVEISEAGMIEVAEGQTLSFRFYGYDRPEGTAVDSYGGFSNNPDGDPAPADGDGFDGQWVNNGSNITITGAVIPEPSHVAAGIAGFALFVTLIIRRRRAVRQ